MAKEFYPIPFRTPPSKPSASMVLRPKPRESRTLPGLPRTEVNPLGARRTGREPARTIQKSPGHESDRGFCFSGFAGPAELLTCDARRLLLQQCRKIGRKQLFQ